VFCLMDDVALLTWRIFGRFVGKSDEEVKHLPPPHAQAAE
jgi:hypothetical protein